MIRFLMVNLTKRKILSLLMFFFLLLTLQIILIKYLKLNLHESHSIKQNNMILEETLNQKADYVSYFKSSVRLRDVQLPNLIETPTAFYQLLVSALNNPFFQETEVTKENEDIDIISFKVVGKSDFFTILRLLLSLRHNSLMIRLKSLDISYLEKDILHFSFVVEGQKEARVETKIGINK